MARKPLSPPAKAATVDAFVDALALPLRALVVATRALILGAGPAITEHIKWNAPSFCQGGEDRVTMRLDPKGGLQLVFHCGARTKASAGFSVADPSGLLHWLAKDRAVVRLTDAADLGAKAAGLKRLVAVWMSATA